MQPVDPLPIPEFADSFDELFRVRTIPEFVDRSFGIRTTVRQAGIPAPSTQER
jgi:hypothetical protein